MSRIVAPASANGVVLAEAYDADFADKLLSAMRYQFDAPFVMDSSAALNELGLAPTPWDEVCRRTAAG